MTRAVVVGGGLVGLGAAVALARRGIETVQVAPKAPPDRRTSALMMRSVDYLREAGLVNDPGGLGHPLTAIRIIDATDRLVRAPETLFEASEAGLEAFGWNFPNIALAEAFAATARTLPNLTTIEAAMTALTRNETGWSVSAADGQQYTADLVVGADGKKSGVRVAAGIGTRERDFREAALVCDLNLGRPLGGTSVEFHYPHGPFTLVPAGGSRANLVWIDERPVLEAAKASGLREALLARSQRLFGGIEVLTPAVVFPLSTLVVETAGRDGVVLVGEAAHAFPPIGAQGLNLGLRDLADLSAVLSEHSEAQQVSDAYAARRSADLVRTGGMVDALFRSLLMEMLPAQLLRAGGLWALKSLPILRRQAFALGMGVR